MSKPRLSDRIRVGVDRTNHAFWILAAMFVISAVFSPIVQHWVMWAFSGFLLALAGYVFLYQSWIIGGGQYTVGPVTMQFSSDSVYQPPDEVRNFIENTWWPHWKDYAKKNSLTFEELLQDVKVEVVEDKPRTPFHKEVAGMTWPDENKRRTVVWHEGLFDMGTFGWELHLQAAHIAWGDKPEHVDHQRLKDHGIVG